ncbi:hypothetical protein GCM10020219_064640 [Nonomuraea dietziae]
MNGSQSPWRPSSRSTALTGPSCSTTTRWTRPFACRRTREPSSSGLSWRRLTRRTSRASSRPPRRIELISVPPVSATVHSRSPVATRTRPLCLVTVTGRSGAAGSPPASRS